MINVHFDKPMTGLHWSRRTNCADQAVGAMPVAHICAKRAVYICLSPGRPMS
jgi:hypothetical protein